MLHDPDAESLFPRLTGEVLQQLIEAGTELELGPGDVLFQEGDQDYSFFVVLEGEVHITKQVGGKEHLLTIHDPGEFTGEISMLTGGPAIASGRSGGKGRVLRLAPADFRRLVAECAPVARVVLSAMAARASDVDAQLRQQEKMAALGKLSAGLAHELNNPAAAARRSASQLRESISGLQGLVLARSQPFSEAERQVLGGVQRRALDCAARSELTGLDPLAQSDLEDSLSNWLEDHGVPDAWKTAPVLAAAGISPDELEAMAGELGAEGLAAVLPWIEGLLNLSDLLDQVETSAARISELVKAVKEYSYMDRAPQQEIDLHEGLESTLKILNHKLRKGIELVREYDPGLPKVCAWASELNQVWTNLIDNSIDAMGETGRLTLRTRQDGDHAVVEVIDDGPGIPEALHPRVFEPFFTTKAAGKGSGLGLDIARRTVRTRHRGEIRFDSRPGETRFEVRLPLCGVMEE